MARQGRNESPQEFADRCRTLAQRITCQSDDPVAQRVHRENAERMLLASYLAGLIGVPGTQVRYASPVSIEEAIRIAVSVQEAERQEKFNKFLCATTTAERVATAVRDTRSVHVRPAKQRVDARRFQGVPTRQRPRALGTRRPSLPYAVTNAKG